MRVWLLHIGEDLPVDGDVRKFRYGYLADALVERGHEVVRWAPTFRHNTKSHRFTGDQRVEINPRYAIEFVHSAGYRRNIGLERLRTYRQLGIRLRARMACEPAPDLLVAAIPSLEWADAAVAFGRSRSLPVVIDVRDLWPDVFFNALPRATRAAGRWLFAPYRRLARRACRGATALTGVSQEYLDWALHLAGRRAAQTDRVTPLGFELPQISTQEVKRLADQLCERGIDPRRPCCLFAGLFERSYDLETIVEAARRIHRPGRPGLQFLLCGDGAKLASIQRQAQDLPDVHLLGWVDPATLQAAASLSSIGLCAYATDATQSLPNKPFEYMASGLAVVSSLPGELEDMLARHACGLRYRAGDARSLAETLGSLLNDPAKLAAMRTSARATWQQHFRSSEIYLRFAEHLETIASPTLSAA